MKQTVDRDYALQPVPQSARQGFWKMFAVMLGLTFFSASMWSGGSLGAGLTFTQFILVVIAGNLILGLYTGTLGYIGAKTGLSTHLLARYAFGEKGSYVASFMLAATQVGWFGVGVAMFALPVQKVTGIDSYILIAIAGVLMTATAYLGMKALTVLSIIAVPSIAVLGTYSTFEAANTVGGLGGLLEYQPTETIAIAAALTICIGSFISAGTLTPDFARFAKTKKTGFFTTVIAFFIGNSLMFLFGAVGAIATGQSDISEVMFLQGLIIPAIIILGLNIWTTNDNALYASGLGFSHITKISKNKVVIFNGIVGTIFAMWLYNNFVGWLTFLGSTLPPIGAIILADYFLVRRKQGLKESAIKVVNWTALAAWVIGVLAATFIPGIAPLNALFASALAYVVLTLIQTRRNKQEEVVIEQKKVN
ncbi:MULTISPECIES: cytosine permease [Alkalihalobacterium]|uniref:Cytosine permease n=1 Tax=Alkalihalobacterium chitinilyticum TaxID=2980103 RepID=A0ABT5VFX7_9BACI|nr:cytosine permease [Alkalihalobacterium chitinilyticum]MDE5414352.1 cytosine permease [Alkalihalobacterium chitinilyticum]MEB1808815.1 cytosine permease [Bacillaceae bacterium]